MSAFTVDEPTDVVGTDYVTPIGRLRPGVRYDGATIVGEWVRLPGPDGGVGRVSLASVRMLEDAPSPEVVAAGDLSPRVLALSALAVLVIATMAVGFLSSRTAEDVAAASGQAAASTLADTPPPPLRDDELAMCSEIYPPRLFNDVSAPSGYNGFDVAVGQTIAVDLDRRFRVVLSDVDDVLDGLALGTTCHIAIMNLDASQAREFDATQPIVTIAGWEDEVIGVARTDDGELLRSVEEAVEELRTHGFLTRAYDSYNLAQFESPPNLNPPPPVTAEALDRALLEPGQLTVCFARLGRFVEQVERNRSLTRGFDVDVAVRIAGGLGLGFGVVPTERDVLLGPNSPLGEECDVGMSGISTFTAATGGWWTSSPYYFVDGLYPVVVIADPQSDPALRDAVDGAIYADGGEGDHAPPLDYTDIARQFDYPQFSDAVND